MQPKLTKKSNTKPLVVILLYKKASISSIKAVTFCYVRRSGRNQPKADSQNQLNRALQKSKYYLIFDLIHILYISAYFNWCIKIICGYLIISVFYSISNNVRIVEFLMGWNFDQYR